MVIDRDANSTESSDESSEFSEKSMGKMRDPITLDKSGQ
jgi:hypothetical protein